MFSGYDFNKGLDYHELFKNMLHCGFQATNFALAVEEINKMLQQRSVPLPEDQADTLEDDEFIKRKSQCTIFLGYTSNMVSSGIREVIRFLVQHKFVCLYICYFYSVTFAMCSICSLMLNMMFLGRLHCYHRWWSRGRFHKMFGTDIYWKFLSG